MHGTVRTLTLIGLLCTGFVAGAQECNPEIALTRPDSRYTDNGDGTVTDNVTGLMWKQCPEGMSTNGIYLTCDTGSAATYDWQEALVQVTAVNAATYAGFDDWRLPNVKELFSLVETACAEPAINLTLFGNTPSAFFWSSSLFAGSPDSAWAVWFAFYGGPFYNVKSSPDGHVRLVRTAR